ncbi:MAG: 30S ribosomal protein S6, partial [Thermomicrobiales bacterium]
MREHASEPRDYEMMVVVTPTVAEEGLPPVIERVSGYITSQGGTVSSTINENPWGRRRLAYQINDHRDAFYVLYRFIARGEKVVEIERDMKLDEAIIRYLVVRYDEMTEHEERAPRQPAESPGGPSFRRSRPEGQTAPAGPVSEAAAAVESAESAETPAEEAAPAAAVEASEAAI